MRRRSRGEWLRCRAVSPPPAFSCPPGMLLPSRPAPCCSSAAESKLLPSDSGACWGIGLTSPYMPPRIQRCAWLCKAWTAGRSHLPEVGDGRERKDVTQRNIQEKRNPLLRAGVAPGQVTAPAHCAFGCHHILSSCPCTHFLIRGEIPCSVPPGLCSQDCHVAGALGLMVAPAARGPSPSPTLLSGSSPGEP